MPRVFFRERPTKLPPDEARLRIHAALAEALPGAGLTVALAGEDPVVAWEDGPAGGTVADVVAGVVNWEVRTVGPAERGGGPAVLLDRSFSDAALAVAVVRHRASSVRPYASDDAKAVAAVSALLEVDHPARSGYPVPDEVARLLLAAPEPAGLAVPEGATRADRLSAKLTALGYDALWAKAWSGLA